MLGGTKWDGSPGARALARVSKQQRKQYLRTLRYYRRKRVRDQLRQARRVLTLVKARKATVIAVVGGAIVAVLAMGGTLGALLAHHWWLR